MTLIDRLSKLEGADPRLDCDIHSLFAKIPRGFVLGSSSGAYLIAHGKRGQVWTEKTPPYTASVDAAIALAERVLPGWGWLTQNCGTPKAIAVKDDDLYEAQAVTPAIALCIAILRAKEASHGE